MERALIFADIDETIGDAHLRRCALLANEINASWVNVRLVVPDNVFARTQVKIIDRSIHEDVDIFYRKIPECERNTGETFQPFPEAVLATLPANSSGFTRHVIDSYRATAEQLAALKKRCDHLTVIDDSNRRRLNEHSGHLIANVNLPKGAVDYGNANAAYVPDIHMIRPDFFEERTRNPNQVFIAFSGIDDGRICVAFLNELSKISPDLGHEDLIYKVALRKDLHPDFVEVQKELLKKYGNRIEFIKNYDGPTIMGESGLKIGNTGQVCVEAIAAGLPLVGLFMLGERVPAMERYYSSNGVVLSDISNITSGVDRSREIAQQSRDVLPMLQEKRGITFTRPNKNGFANLAQLIIRG